MSVYFITCRETGTLKIGSSLDPHDRLKALQTAHPFELKLEAILPGGTEEEFNFHRHFSEDRLKGEWFRINEMMELIIKNNPAGSPPDHDATARRRAEEIRQDPQEQAYAVALERAKNSPRLPPRLRPMSRVQKQMYRDGQRRLNGESVRGDIYFPFRNGGTHTR